MIGKTAERDDIGCKKKNRKVYNCFIYKNIYRFCHISKIKEFIIDCYKNNRKKGMSVYQKEKSLPK